MAFLGTVAFLWQIAETRRSRTESFIVDLGAVQVTDTNAVAPTVEVVNRSASKIYIRRIGVRLEPPGGAHLFSAALDSVVGIEPNAMASFSTTTRADVAEMITLGRIPASVRVQTTRKAHTFRIEADMTDLVVTGLSNIESDVAPNPRRTICGTEGFRRGSIVVEPVEDGVVKVRSNERRGPNIVVVERWLLCPSDT